MDIIDAAYFWIEGINCTGAGEIFARLPANWQKIAWFIAFRHKIAINPKSGWQL